MNKKEITEIRKQFRPEYDCIKRIAGCYVDGDKNKVLSFKKNPAELPEEELFKYLAYNMIYPADAAKNKVEGRVLVTFVIEHDGSISNVNVVNSVYPSLDKEAIRVVSEMPKWIPGKANGKTVRVKYTIPITFRLS